MDTPTPSPARERARERTAWLRQVVETALDAFISLDEQGLVQEWNPAAEATFGWRREEVVGRPLTDLIIPPRHHAGHDQGRQHFLATGEGPVLGRRIELPARTKDGREIPVELTITALASDDGTSFNAFLHDISERKEAEAALRRREQALAEAQRIAKLGSWEWDLRADAITWSAELYRMFGVDPERFEADYEGYQRLLHPDDRAMIGETVQRAIEEGGSYDIIHRVVRPDGSLRWLHGRGEAIVDPATGATVRLVGTSQDVTEQREAEERERQLGAERMARQRAEAEAEGLTRLTRELERSNAELDHFAYIASHDLKAPLRGIGNLATWIEEDLADRLTDQAREYLELLAGRVYRMESLIDGLLSFSRAGRRREDPERVAVAEMVREILDLLSPQTTVELVLAPDLPVLETERLPLQQVFQNLLSNAIKYGGTDAVTITVECRDRGAFWELSVRDDGPGIDPEFQDKAWVMFQTLQPRDEVEGTGIGLALVKKTVASRGGTVGLESDKGAGARFWFTWPKRTESPLEMTLT